MLLRELFANPKTAIIEGGNVEIDGHQAQHINLKVHQRGFIVPILNNLLHGINHAYHAQYKDSLWAPKSLNSQEFLSGSSLHFFNTAGITDQQFVQHKPTVGDIDTMVDLNKRDNLAAFLQSVQGQKVGPAVFLGYKLGNEQFSSLWEFHNPPIKVQIDFEFVKFDQEAPTQWAKFSHSSSWDDLQAGVKGVFHKYIIQSLAGLTRQDFLLRKLVGRGKARAEQDVPTTDNMVSFAVSSKEGGGLRQKYDPVIDPATGQPLVTDGLPVMTARPTSGYIQDVGQIFSTIAGHRISPAQAKKLEPKFWSFVGILDIMNHILDDEEKEQVANSFIEKLFGKGAQGLYKGDPNKDANEKNAALNKLFSVLKISVPRTLDDLRREYYDAYKTASLNEAEVKAQIRKGMPHLRDLKPADFLDLVDELRAEGGRFELQNIPLNVKIDGFGGRFGKNADGQPFMATSRTEPRYKAGFLQYHKEKGTTDPEILGRAANFDKLFNEMMSAIELVDSELGPDFLVDRQVTCEVLFLPFATKTDEGKLKFVGIEYDQFPEDVELVLVPYRIVEASTGQDIPHGDKIAQQIAELGQHGNVAFVSNRLVQKKGLDVTEIINPLDNIEELKSIVSGTTGKRDRASLALRREVEAKLKPVQIALEKAIDEDPNIVGKDNLGQDYEGIVINSRLGPIKVTSQRQKDIITQKNAAKAAARAEHGRDNANKTAVVAIGSFIGHIGHQQLWQYTRDKAEEIGGDPFLFIGNAEGKDDPIPPATKVQTWHKLYPAYAKNISTVMQGGSLMQKIKHELINPLPGKPPRYDNIIIMVGEDRASMPIANALMKAVNKFQGYEHVRVHLEVTPRGTGQSGTALRKVLLDVNKTPEQQFEVWNHAFNSADYGAHKLTPDWIHHLMDVTRRGMGVAKPHTSPNGVRTNMSPKDDDYAINYGQQGLAEPVSIKEANRMIRQMKAKEIISEDSNQDKIDDSSKRASTQLATTPNANLNGGDAYLNYRMNLALAGAPDYPTKAESEIGGDPLYSAYTDAEWEMIKMAAKITGAGPLKQLNRKRSEEMPDVNKTSPVAAPKKNKYGI